MSDDDILRKIIDKIINPQNQNNNVKEFYQSLKENDSNQGFDSYCYLTKGVKIPRKEIKARQPRFVSFKAKPSNEINEPEKPLLEKSVLTDIVKKEDFKLNKFKTTAPNAIKYQNTRTSSKRNNRYSNLK